ncbi:MAG: sigma-70 family RNA polymerase sigma factor [Candidatus Omnitrophica bacterium]|nr:sigma-70 family RNA polymerase sigma factor [Candidatus Omnitrophota bacterium]
MTDEKKLIRQAQRGNVDAFIALLRTSENRLKSTAFALCPQEPEDLLQETYLASFKSIRRFRGRSSFYTWIYRIMLNLAYKKFRKNKQKEILARKTHLKSISGDTPVPEYEIDKKETIRSAISKLPLQYKEIITLYYFEEMSVEEIARHLNLNPGTVKSRLFNAREHLKNLVEPK